MKVSKRSIDKLTLLSIKVAFCFLLQAIYSHLNITKLYRHGLPELALGWFPLGFGLVLEAEQERILKQCLL